MADSNDLIPESLKPLKPGKVSGKLKHSENNFLLRFIKKYSLLRILPVFMSYPALLIPSELILGHLLKRRILLQKKNVNSFFLHPLFLTRILNKKLRIQIDPNLIDFYLSDWIEINGSDIHVSDYFFGVGDWQKILISTQRSSVENELKEMLLNDWNYKNSNIYKHYFRRMKQNNYKSRQHVLLNTSEKIDDYFERFHRLFLSISKDGYLSIDMLKKIKGLDFYREVGVAVGANGDLYKLPGGQHRFAIARYLKLKIPVEVRLVHVDFIKKNKIQTPLDLYKVISSFNK